MKRNVLLLLLACFMTTSLCACGSGTASPAATQPAQSVQAALPPSNPQNADDWMMNPTNGDFWTFEELKKMILCGQIDRDRFDMMMAAGVVDPDADHDGLLAMLNEPKENWSYEDLERMILAGSLDYAQLCQMADTGEIDGSLFDRALELLEKPKTGSIFWDYPELNNTTRDMVIINATSFNEGVAWITVEDATDKGNGSHVMLIDTAGKVLYYYHDKSHYREYGNPFVKYTNFSHGVSLLYIKYTPQVLMINTKGEVIWDSAKDVIPEAEKLFGVGSVEDVVLTLNSVYMSSHYEFAKDPNTFNGYFLAEIKVNTFEKTGSFYTVIQPDGTWLFDPTESLVYMPCDETIGTAYYCMRRELGENGSRLITAVNLDTGETASAIYNGQDWNDWFIVNLGYKYIDELSKWKENYERSKHNGLLYNEQKNGFTDASGNIVIDCSDYKVATNPVFNDGYCALNLYNEGGGQYVTVIDTAGNQLFNPVKRPSDAYYQTYSDGYFWGGKGHYLSLTGDTFSVDFYYSKPFSCGYALVWPSYYGVPHLTFLNTSFQDAFPQDGTGPQPTQAPSKSYITMDNFSIEGKWKNIGSQGFGQAQPGAIVAFDGTKCNFFSPSDTYAFYKNDGIGGVYVLDTTSSLGQTLTFVVKIIDANHVDIIFGETVTELQRVT